MNEDPPPHAMEALKFAYRIANHYIARGGDITDLFGALAGLVVMKDRELGYSCLMAIDEVSQTQELMTQELIKRVG